jgi:TRAP-type C4-dicarboxylate transport system substrate-binding protein
VKRTILATLLLALAAPAAAQEVTIKLGTLAPAGSNWHEILKELAEKWQQASGGKVKVRIYPGGTQGNEGEMVRKMAVGQLQAAAVTSVGLHDIIPEPNGLIVPLMFDGEAELLAVLERMRGKLDALLDKRGYVGLQWGIVGQVKLFCTKPYRTPAEAKGAKVFAWEGDPGSVEAWKLAGFSPVVLSSTDLLPALQTGMVNCVATVPLYALTARIFEKASSMMDVNWGILVGATVVKKDAWEKIPAEVRPKLAAIARDLGKKVDAEVDRLNADAIAEMKKQGLTVVPVDQADWKATAESTWPVLRGKVVPAEFFDEVRRERDAVRASKAGKK